MSRHENADISSLNIDDAVKVETWYDADGIDYDDITDLSNPCAKKVFYPHTGRMQYYIMCAAGKLLDPHTMDARYIKNTGFKMQGVQKDKFDFYIRFLRHHRLTYLKQAERNM